LLITVSGADMSNLFICNGPVRYIPIENMTDACAIVDPRNLLADAESGTMGSFPAGTPANTGVPTEPFPGNVPGFSYVLPQTAPGHAPEEGQYTVQNIMNNDNSNVIGAWWRIADRTAGNETGRMMVVNGHTPGACFFTETVDVEPGTFYLFSTWICNLFKALGWANPALGVQILDEDGQQLHAEMLSAQIPVNTAMPEWRQVGTVIYSHENTKLTVRFLSEGPAAIGNDFAIDNVALQKIHVPVFTPVKECNKTSIGIGKSATYTIMLENTCESPLTDVAFQDSVPDGLTFIPDSVTVNGASVPGVDPKIGFSVPDIAGGGSAVVAFDVIAKFVPDSNPTVNQANIAYQYAPAQGGAPGTFRTKSNEVSLRIVAPPKSNPPCCQIPAPAFQPEGRVDIARIVVLLVLICALGGDGG